FGSCDDTKRAEQSVELDSRFTPKGLFIVFCPSRWLNWSFIGSPGEVVPLCGRITVCWSQRAQVILKCMIADIRQHLEAALFEPFTIVTSSGTRYGVPSADHAGLNPRGTRVVVWFDD